MADSSAQSSATSAADAAAKLQAQLQPSPLVPDAPGQDPAAQMQALMAQMKDLHTPEAVGWWPLAPGWWLLTFIVVSLVVGAITWFYLRRRRTAYRRAGLRLIKRVDAQDLNPQFLARRLNEILKRTALASPLYKGMGLAAAHGANWAAFLCSSCPNYPHKEALTAQLIKALYQRNAKLDGEALVGFCHFWIGQHQAVIINFAGSAPTEEAPHAAT